MIENVTAVLITKEKTYPKEVLAALPEFEEVIIETECPNIYRRYMLAKTARTPLVYVQDDDCTIDVEALFKHYNGLLTNAITNHHKRFYEGKGMTLIGFGAFFPKGMADFLTYLDKFGPDDLLLSQADRVFTYLNQPHHSIVMPIHNFSRATDSTRMSTQPDHWTNLDRIVERCLQL